MGQTWLDYLTKELRMKQPPPSEHSARSPPFHFTTHTFVGGGAAAAKAENPWRSVAALRYYATTTLRVDLNDGNIHGRRISNLIS